MTLRGRMTINMIALQEEVGVVPMGDHQALHIAEVAPILIMAEVVLAWNMLDLGALFIMIDSMLQLRMAGTKALIIACTRTLPMAGVGVLIVEAGLLSAGQGKWQGCCMLEESILLALMRS